MTGIMISLLVIIGVVQMLAAAVGVLRMPDMYCRLHAASLATTFGIGSFMLAALVYFTAQNGTFPFKLFLIFLFVFFTGPVGSHMMSRAAYLTKVKLWEGTFVDEMKNYLSTKQ